MKNGYKKTSLGILPNEWEVVKLREICEINPKNIDKLPSKFYYINLESVEKGNLLNTKEIYKNKAPSRAKRILKKGDILFQLVRPYQKNNFYFDLDGNFVASTGYAQLRTKENKKFIFQYLHFDKFVNAVIEKCTGSNYPAINSSTFSNLKIPLPPLNEQRKIAEILSTFDEVILLTSNLINAKKEFKKALMQNLLTAKIRFTNFKDIWKEVKLGDIGEFKTSSVDKIINSNEKIVSLINYMDVYKNTHISKKLNLSKTSATEQEINKFYIQKGDILFTPSSETPDDIGHSAVIIDDFDCALYSYHLIRFRTFNKFDICFLGYIFNNEKILKQFTRLSQGTTRYTLSIKDFQNIKIKLPNLAEQTKIAEILSSVDEEINLLNKKLEQLNLQKRGVMQNLLSGKVRVK